MRGEATGNGFRDLVTFRQLNARRGVFVAGVKRIVGAGDKDLAPFHQARGEEAGDGAKDNFLKKRGLHFP